MRHTNRLNLSLVFLILFLCILGCKTAEEKERQQQRAAERQQKADQKQKTADVIKTLDPNLDSWAKLAPQVKLVKEPYIKEKLVIVYRRDGGINEVLEGDVVGLGDLHASTADEVGMVVQSDCFIVRRGSYVTKDEEKKEIPAYISECEIHLVDLSLPAVIHRQKFENTELADEINSMNVDWETIKKKNRVVAREPREAIRDFLRNLPRR